MPMPGVDFKTVREAILDSYSEDDLRMTLYEVMDVKLDHVVGSGSLTTRVFQLLEWAEQHGREAELIRAVAASRPRKAKLQDVYAKYGMAVPISVFKPTTDGMESAPILTSAGSGFEKTLQPHVPFLDPVAFREGISTAEMRVCQITFQGTAQGTGFLIGPDVILTNYHVVEDVLKGELPPSDVECVFDFKKLVNRSISRTPLPLHATEWNIDSSPYTAGEKADKPDEGIPTPDELDYALLRLAQPVGAMPWAAHPGSGAPNRGWYHLPDTQPNLESPMGLIIAQHPNGWPMKIGMDMTAINQSNIPPHWINSNGTRIRYRANTEGGSSGSPVFDFNWNLIALHHYGDPARGHAPQWNQGVPIGKIRDRLIRTGKSQLLGSNSN